MKICIYRLLVELIRTTSFPLSTIRFWRSTHFDNLFIGKISSATSSSLPPPLTTEQMQSGKQKWSFVKLKIARVKIPPVESMDFATTKKKGTRQLQKLLLCLSARGSLTLHKTIMKIAIEIPPKVFHLSKND